MPYCKLNILGANGEAEKVISLFPNYTISKLPTNNYKGIHLEFSWKLLGKTQRIYTTGKYKSAYIFVPYHLHMTGSKVSDRYPNI